MAGADALPGEGSVSRLLDAGAAGVAPKELTPGERGALAVVAPQGYELIVREFDVPDDRPRRRHGRVYVHDVPGLATYWLKHRAYASELYAAVGPNRDGIVVGVLNASDGDDDHAGYGDHRVVLQLSRHPEWIRWTQFAGRLLPQRQFAELVEAGISQITTIDPATGEPVPGLADASTMLDVAQTLVGNVSIEAKSAERLRDGQRQIVRVETVTGRAGTTGELDIPTEFRLALRPWLGAQVAVVVTARLRYRFDQESGRAELGYELIDLDEHLEGAATMLIRDIEDAVNLGPDGESEPKVVVIRGVPADPIS
jgi:uncharacterized protein YfdQ (DUF2303 family)